MSNISLDQQITDFIKRRGGRVSTGYLRLVFDNYSRGYLYDRIQVLKKCNLIREYSGEYILTKKVK